MELFLKQIMDYSFYDESGNLIVKLDKEKLKQLFECDEIILEETEHL